MNLATEISRGTKADSLFLNGKFNDSTGQLSICLMRLNRKSIQVT